MRVVSQVWKAFVANQSGATAIEYGLICSLIFLVIVGAVQAFADGTTAMFFLLAATMP